MKKRPCAVEVLAANLNKLIAKHGEANRRLAIAAGVGEGTIQRIRKGQAAAGVDTVECLAHHFKLEPWQLLVEDFDPSHPPAITFPSAAERELYEKFKALAASLR